MYPRLILSDSISFFAAGTWDRDEEDPLPTDLDEAWNFNLEWEFVKRKILGSTPDLLNQKLWGVEPSNQLELSRFHFGN